METPSFDVIVVGAGPAGLTAATEAARAGLKVLCLDKLAPGGVLINLSEVHDYKERSSGPDLASRLADEADVAGVEMGFGEVTRVSQDGAWKVETAEGEPHGARALVVATGLNKGRLGLANEAEFEGRGISHCASCDGPLFAGLSVVVAGGSGWAAYEARELRGLASEVTVVVVDDDDNTAAATMPAATGIARIDGRIVALEGKGDLQSVVVESGGARTSLAANGLFVYVGQSPAAEFLPDSLARDASGHIVVDAEGRTSAPLVFAVGDVRAGSRPYLSDAIADGERAAKALVRALKEK